MMIKQSLFYCQCDWLVSQICEKFTTTGTLSTGDSCLVLFVFENYSVEKHSKEQKKVVWNTPPTNKKEKENIKCSRGKYAGQKKKIKVRWNNVLHQLSSMHTPHKNTQTIPYRGKRRKMAQACRNDSDKRQHFTCSYTTHAEHTPSPHCQCMRHRAVRQIEKWFISHKCSHPAPYAEWSVQICLSIALLLQHRNAPSSPTQHLHSQTPQPPTIQSLPQMMLSH